MLRGLRDMAWSIEPASARPLGAFSRSFAVSLMRSRIRSGANSIAAACASRPSASTMAIVPLSGGGLGLNRYGPSTAIAIIITGTSTTARMNALVRAVALNSRQATSRVLCMGEFLLGLFGSSRAAITHHHLHEHLLKRDAAQFHRSHRAGRENVAHDLLGFGARGEAQFDLAALAHR